MSAYSKLNPSTGKLGRKFVSMLGNVLERREAENPKPYPQTPPVQL